MINFNECQKRDEQHIQERHPIKPGIFILFTRYDSLKEKSPNITHLLSKKEKKKVTKESMRI